MGLNGSGSASDDENKCVHHYEKILHVPARECCIYRVPKKLRKINEEAYTPQIISIGPFHRDKNDLLDMQKQKERYLDEFLKRIDEKNFEKLKTFVTENEQGIRNCYSEAIFELSSEEFIEMILYDAVFIIELFLRNEHRNEYESDFLLHQQWLTNAIRLDLQLLENQLPYFVLRTLYILAFQSPTGGISPPFLDLSCKFFGYDYKPAGNLVENEKNLKHFLDMRRCAMVEFRPKPEPPNQATAKEASTDIEEGTIQDLPFAVMLDESGVKFRPAAIPKSDNRLRLLDIKFQKGKGRISIFRGLELQIPRITIEDSTECLMRNLMALEQCCYPSDTHICNYIDLIDCLINTRKDVDLLFEKGIISNHVGDHTTISQMFNKLCIQITKSDSCYKKLILDLKAYHERWWNRTKATLMSVYFRDIWRGTATTAATVILLLTVLQTMQRLWGGWTPPRK